MLYFAFHVMIPCSLMRLMARSLVCQVIRTTLVTRGGDNATPVRARFVMPMPMRFCEFLLCLLRVCFLPSRQLLLEHCTTATLQVEAKCTIEKGCEWHKEQGGLCLEANCEAITDMDVCTRGDVRLPRLHLTVLCPYSSAPDRAI